MAEPLDILDDRDPLAGPFLGSLVFHVSVVALLFVGWFWAKRAHETLGEVNPAGGPAYAVSPVHTIPVPQRDTPPNPVAHDTQSAVPAAPDKQDEEKKLVMPPLRDAFEIPDKLKLKSERPKRKQQYTEPTPPNQIYTRSQQAVSIAAFDILWPRARFIRSKTPDASATSFPITIGARIFSVVTHAASVHSYE